MGHLADIQFQIETLARLHRLRTPGRRIPNLYLTEFGYFNRRFLNRSDDRHFHSDARRADWWRDALDHARKNKAQMTLLYHGTENPSATYRPDCTKIADIPERATDWDSGLFGAGGVVHGNRCYGKDPSPAATHRRDDVPQPRVAACEIADWALGRTDALPECRSG